MEFTVLGTGALGGYYGGMIARNGDTVRFIARRDLEALRQNGLRVESKHGNIHIVQPEVYALEDNVPPSDVVLVTCKTTCTQEVIDRIPALLKPGGLVITLQNGLSVEKPLREVVEEDRLLSGVCFLCAERVDAGSVRQYGFDRISLGYFTPFGHVKAARVLAHLHHGGIDAILVKNVAHMRWEKLLWNIPFSGLATRYDMTVDELLENHEPTIRKIMHEVLTAGMRLTGWQPKEDIIDTKLAKTRQMQNYAPAMLLDYRAERDLEIDAIIAEPLRHAEAAGIAMPVVQELAQALQEIIEKENL